MSTSTESLKQLLALAEKATPGKWWTGDGSEESCHHGDYAVLAKVEEWTVTLLQANSNFRERARRDAAFVAACSPDVIAELVTELLAARAFRKSIAEEYADWNGVDDHQLASAVGALLGFET